MKLISTWRLTTMSKLIETGRKEHWNPGEEAWFEYHCFESMDSDDSDLWLRSHSKVEVLSEADWEKELGQNKTIQERLEAGIVKVYQIQFPDGYRGDCFEDELFTEREYWYRPDPPIEFDVNYR
jgi:hypothetical protein